VDSISETPLFVDATALLLALIAAAIVLHQVPEDAPGTIAITR